jgi:hypothetical protein
MGSPLDGDSGIEFISVELRSKEPGCSFGDPMERVVAHVRKAGMGTPDLPLEA